MNVPPGFRVIAHRGASAYAPENTWPAFALARSMGAREVELDVQLSCDRRVVICHDDTLERYGHGPRRVEDCTGEELLRLDMGSWFSAEGFAGTPMLSLAELLDRAGRDFVYHIELKGQAADLAAETRAVVVDRGLGGQVIYTAFAVERLERMRSLDAEARLGWLVADIDPPRLEVARALGLLQLCPPAEQIDRQKVERAREVVPEVRAWGLRGDLAQRSRLVQRLLDAGCDGVTTNWPDQLKPEG